MENMQPPFPERYWTGPSIEFLSKRFDHPFDGTQQDWPYEVADFSYLDTYLALYDDMSLDEDIRFTLADMIIQAFANCSDLSTDPRWNQFLVRLSENFSIHAYQVWYWAAKDSPEAARWKVSPWMHDLIRDRAAS